MSVNADRNGNVGTVTIVIDVTDILALNVPAAQKRVIGLQRAQQELQRAADAVINTNAALDQRVSDVTADVAATKAARPTGTF
jgi:hypothetical protein